MPADTLLEKDSENAVVSGEITAEQRHATARAMIAEYQRKGMSAHDIKVYILGILDANNPATDNALMQELLSQVNPDTMSQEVVDSEFQSIINQPEINSEENKAADALMDSPLVDSTDKSISELNTEIIKLEKIMSDKAAYPVDSSQRNKLALARQKLIQERDSLLNPQEKSSNQIENQAESISSPVADSVGAIFLDSESDTAEADTIGDAIDSSTSPLETNPKYGYARANREEDRKRYSQLFADQKMEEDLEEGGFIRKRMKRFFKGRILRRYYETKYKQEYQQLTEENNGYLEVPLEILRGVDPKIAQEMAKRASMATTEWLLSQDAQVTGIRRKGEETLEISGDPNVDAQLRTALKGLALRYANGELDDDSIIAERDRLLEGIEDLNEDLFGSGRGFSDSIIELARSVKADIEHGMAMDRVEAALDAMELRGGYTRGSAEAAVRRTLLDKISDKVGTSRIGGTAIAAGLITAASLVFCATDRGATAGAATALRWTGIGAGAAGIIAGATEYGVVKREAALVRQEETYSYDRDTSGNGQRRAMEEAIVYHSEFVPEAIEDLQCYLDENGELRSDLADQEVLDAVSRVAQLKTLLKESDERKIDLLRFSGVASASVERLEMIMSLSAVEIAIESRITKGGSIGRIGPNGVRSEIDIAKAVQQTSAAAERSTEMDVDNDHATHEKAYKKMMAKRVAVAAAAGIATSLVAGAVISETASLVNPNVNGLFEQQQPGKSNTLLTSLIEGQHNGMSMPGGNNQVSEILNSSKGTAIIDHKGTALHVTIPDGFEAQFNKGTNSFDLISKQDGSHIADNIEFTKNGQISNASIDQLRQIGLNLEQHSVNVQGPSRAVGADNFIDYHERRGNLEATKIVDNAINSKPGLIGDHNELSLHAAGENGNWHQRNGSVKVGLGGLTEDGSWNGNKTYNVPQALQDGRGKMMITVNDHFQENGKYKTFLFDVEKDKDGNGWHAVIPKNHPAANWFGNGGSIDDWHGPSLEQLQNPNSSVLDSRNSLTFVIADEQSPKDNDYVSIASIPGTGTGQYEVPTHSVEYRARITGIETPGGETQGSTLPAFGPPIYQRRGVGAPDKQPETPPNPYTYGESMRYGEYGYKGQIFSDEEVERILSEVSPQFAHGDEIKLAEQSKWYEEKLKEDFGFEYLAEIDKIIASDQKMSFLPKNTKALIAIPVGSLYESDNIYSTLSSYASQIDVENGSYSIVLGLNQIEGSLSDPSNIELRNKTLSEIERAKRDFPDLNIIVLDYEIPRKEVEQAGAAIGSVTSRLYDSVSLAAGRQAAVFEQEDILMIRNDADVQGLSPVYVERMLKALERIPDSLAYTGESLLDFTRMMNTHPGLALTVGFDAMLARLNPYRTAGANFGVKIGAYCGMRGTGKNRAGGAGSDDLAIGRRIMIARGKKTIAQQYGGYYIDYMDEDGDKIVSYVGASLESSGERQLRAYANDRNPINSSWSDFSEGNYGYKPRNSNVDPKTKEPLEKSIAKAERFITELINDRRMPRAIAEYYLTRYLGGVGKFRLVTNNDGRLDFKLTIEGRSFIKQLQKGAQLLPSVSGIAGRNIRKVLNVKQGLPRYIRPKKRRFLKRSI